MIQKWNLTKHMYEPYTKANENNWYCPLLVEMDEKINCAECGNEILYGDGYTSSLIHNERGMAYTVCLQCHESEIRAELQAKNLL